MCNDIPCYRFGHVDERLCEMLEIQGRLRSICDVKETPSEVGVEVREGPKVTGRDRSRPCSVGQFFESLAPYFVKQIVGRCHGRWLRETNWRNNQGRDPRTQQPGLRAKSVSTFVVLTRNRLQSGSKTQAQKGRFRQDHRYSSVVEVIQFLLDSRGL